MENWKKEIAVAYLVKQKLAELDIEGLWPFYLPEVAATENELSDVEKSIGHRLDEQYREFLGFANGWKGFSQGTDLLGTKDLYAGPNLLKANELLNSLGPLEAICGIARDECLPIAVSEDDIDVVFVAKQESADPGAVYWFAGTLIERFDDFNEFFLSMVDYDRHEIEELQNGN